MRWWKDTSDAAAAVHPASGSVTGGVPHHVGGQHRAGGTAGGGGGRPREIAAHKRGHTHTLGATSECMCWVLAVTPSVPTPESSLPGCPSTPLVMLPGNVYLLPAPGSGRQNLQGVQMCCCAAAAGAERVEGVSHRIQTVEKIPSGRSSMVRQHGKSQVVCILSGGSCIASHKPPGKDSTTNNTNTTNKQELITYTWRSSAN